MTYSIELFFDPESAARLRSLWSALQEIAGPPARSELGVEPHVSLAVFRAGEPPEAAAWVEQLARTLVPFPLDFTAVEAFSTAEGVVYLRAKLSPALRSAHAEFHHLLGECAPLCLEYYRPEHWIPHCTVATDVPPALTGEVVAACSGSGALGTVRVERIGGVCYRPARLRHAFPLAGSEAGP